MASVLRGSGDSSFGGNLSIEGVLTYEDVSSVDSVGIVTARSGLHVGTGASVFSPDTNELALGTNSGERLRIVSGGNIGIGTNDPGNHKLHLYGASNSDLRLTATGDDIINMFANSNRSSANASLFAIKGEWNGTQVANIKFLVGDDTTNKDDGYITFATRESGDGSSSERLRITSTGKVGIDQTNPQGDLHIGNITGNKDLIMHSVNNGTARLRFREGGSTASGFNEYSIGMVGNRNAMTVNGQGAGEIIRILGDTGKVGILNNNPTHLLHISKNTSGEVAGIKISGNDGSGDGGSGVNLADNETVKWSIFTRRHSKNNRL